VVQEHGVSVVLSSHLVADLERVCDYLIVLVGSRVQVAGEIDALLASHRRVTSPDGHPGNLPVNHEVIEKARSDGENTLLVRTDQPVVGGWTVEPVSLEDIVLAYMSRGQSGQANGSRGGTQP
jgi:ABC-2 type transport system ATP-binding protein